MASSNTSTLVTALIVVVIAGVLVYLVDPTFFGLFNVKQGFTGAPNVPISNGNLAPGQMNNNGAIDHDNNTGNRNAAPTPAAPSQDMNSGSMEGPADFGSAEAPAGCYPRDQLTPSELLPKDNNTAWSEQNPMGPGSLKGKNFLSAGALLGVNTVGQSLRNSSWQLRSEPPNPQVPVSIFNQSTIQPDVNRRPLEIN
jgi:hypothetical protein